MPMGHGVAALWDRPESLPPCSFPRGPGDPVVGPVRSSRFILSSGMETKETAYKTPPSIASPPGRPRSPLLPLHLISPHPARSEPGSEAPVSARVPAEPLPWMWASGLRNPAVLCRVIDGHGAFSIAQAKEGRKNTSAGEGVQVVGPWTSKCNLQHKAAGVPRGNGWAGDLGRVIGSAPASSLLLFDDPATVSGAVRAPLAAAEHLRLWQNPNP